MKINRILFDILLIAILVPIFGLLSNRNPFASFTTFFIVFGASWFIGTIMTLPFQSIAYSFLAIKLSIAILIFSAIIQQIFPSQYKPIVIPSEDIMGNHPQARWELMIYHKEIKLLNYKIYQFTGTSEQSKIYTQRKINEWNTEHPNAPVTDHSRYLTYLPYSHAYENRYPLDYSR